MFQNILFVSIAHAFWKNYYQDGNALVHYVQALVNYLMLLEYKAQHSK